MFRRNSKRLPIRLFLPTAALVIGVAMASPSQAAGTVVNVSLWDKGAQMAMVTDLGFPAAGKDMSKGPMVIEVSPDTVKPAKTRLEVLNPPKAPITKIPVTRLKVL